MQVFLRASHTFAHKYEGELVVVTASLFEARSLLSNIDRFDRSVKNEEAACIPG